MNSWDGDPWPTAPHHTASDADSDWTWSLAMQVLVTVLFGAAAWIGGYWMASPLLGPPWPFLLLVAVIFGAALIAHAVTRERQMPHDA